MIKSPQDNDEKVAIAHIFVDGCFLESNPVTLSEINWKLEQSLSKEFPFKRVLLYYEGLENSYRNYLPIFCYLKKPSTRLFNIYRVPDVNLFPEEEIRLSLYI